MTKYDTNKPYIQYIEDVLSGKQIANWFIKKQCERTKAWFERDDIELRYDEIDRKINLVQKIKHKKGLQAGKPFLLLPFQQFIFMNIFGWYFVDSDRRVISNVLLMMARQTGKSYIAAAIALAIALDKSLPSPTVDYIANSAKQSSIAFGHCSDQFASLDPKGVIFKRYRSEIRVPLTGATVNVLSSDTSKLDGRASYFVADEIHENKDWKIWEILKSGQGSLKNPLAIGISTAGWWIGEDYPLYSMWCQAKKVLSGTVDDDSWFYMIFQLDEDDDWQNPDVWEKAIPTLGVAVDKNYITERIQEAINMPSKETEIKTKNLNMWCQSQKTWIPYNSIKAVSKPIDLSDFKDAEYSIVGLDIAERNDLCVLCTLIEKDDLLYFKAFPFVSNIALNKSKNKYLYKQWVKQGYLFATDTDTIDISYIIKKTQEINEQVPIALVAYDAWHAQQFKIFAEKEGLPCRAVKQGLGYFAEPTSMLEDLILSKKCVIDDNPVTRWCFSNVLIKEDENSNRKPVKSSKDNKIDIVITFIQAVRLWMELKGIINDTPIKAVTLN